MPRLLLATRSADKLREIRQVLARNAGLGDSEIVSLAEAGIGEDAAEDDLESGSTFEANALAKATYFASLSGMTTLADDSGLCVDALGGAPGVRSKRFSGRHDLRGAELDLANNARLLEQLAGVPPADRTARYVCVVALATPGGEAEVFRGECEGTILEEPRGSGGFGYDPLFLVAGQEATFGELAAKRKNELSHRAAALRGAAPAARRALDRLRGVH